MSLTAGERIDVVNIGLMLVSCAIAMVIPFELFLFSYAILGPLHYLTEISWLHDKKYYTKGKYDAVVLVIVGLLITIFNFSKYLSIDFEFPQNFAVSLTYIAFLASIIFVFVKNNFIRIAGLLLIILTSQLSEHFWMFFLVFLPTLIHVYIFTGLFMLYGAIKSKSKMGILSVVVLLLCPVILYTVFPNTTFFGPSGYGIGAYDMFRPVNRYTLSSFMNIPEQPSQDKWDAIIFHSQAGVLLMRFIAFAYTYHYLNWFSKTQVIRWNKVPKARLAGVIVIWLISISLYIYNYSVGLQWLFFLSFLHVLLEFPLNYISVAGIGGYLRDRFLRPNHTPASVGKK